MIPLQNVWLEPHSLYPIFGGTYFPPLDSGVCGMACSMGPISPFLSWTSFAIRSLRHNAGTRAHTRLYTLPPTTASVHVCRVMASGVHSPSPPRYHLSGTRTHFCAHTRPHAHPLTPTIVRVCRVWAAGFRDYAAADQQAMAAAKRRSGGGGGAHDGTAEESRRIQAARIRSPARGLRRGRLRTARELIR